MGTNIYEIKQTEAETQAYKMFMRIARKLSYMEYGKWKIVPDAVEPLRKFTIEKEFDWAKVKLCLVSHQFRKRKYDNYDDAYAWKFQIGLQGFFQNIHGNEVMLKTGMFLKPRMVRKLLEAVNTKFIPSFYNMVETDRLEHEAKLISNKMLADNIAKLKGLITIEKNRYDCNSYTGHLPTEPTILWKGIESSNMTLSKDKVRWDIEVDYDTAKKLLEALRG